MSDTKKSPLRDDVLLKAAKSTLDDKAVSLDDDVCQRLQQARRVAVSAAANATQGSSPRANASKWLLPAGSFAALALVSSVVVYQFQAVQESSPVASIEDIPILTSPDELELYEELDFYQWLAEEHDSVG
ncbi:MAG: hypothetical protein AMJ53_14905 [Gammaproteobacteria bacterium SG8_11]|nr:MAG: hypothetical protein AMJ53_14905 [Gammaproteobacteria bacterium SG8_11]